MSPPGALATPPATESQDYGATYYQAHLGTSEPYSWDTPHWRTFFTQVAAGICAATGAANVLDVGCARGLLVQALRERGIEARGVDVSEHAIETAHPDVRPYLAVAGADTVEGTYDLVTCVEVLEHMSPTDVERAIDAMCATSDRVLLSSSPTDFVEPTHVNVREPAAWATSFAQRGFFRRTDVDLAFLTPWAVLFERTPMSTPQVVHRYEAYAYPLRAEVLEKRVALLEAHRRISALEESEEGTDKLVTIHRERDDLRTECEDLRRLGDEARQECQALREDQVELRHRLLLNRDHAIGIEAEAEAARRQTVLAHAKVSELTAELSSLGEALGKAESRTHELDAHINEIKRSSSWRIGRMVVRPLSRTRHT